MMSALEESLTGDSHDVVDQPANVITKVATLNHENFKFEDQEQFGRPYNKDNCMIFHMVIPNPESTAFLVDLYTYSSRVLTADERDVASESESFVKFSAKTGEPPQHLGYHYIMPGQLKNSIGNIEVPITCAIKNRPIGLMYIEYLVVKPMQNYKCNFAVSYAKHWTSAWTGLDVGHRGLGTSFRDKNGGSVRENTIASMKSAAAHGADMVEFDVQLSKDYVPIIYHDFQVCVSMRKKKYYEYSEMLELPVKELTLEQLQKLKVYHVVEGRENEQRFFDEDLEEHQPFPQLSEVLNVIDTKVGFNVEIKWTMRLKDGSYELYNPFDMNMYVDKILEVVLKNAGERRIVFSCFHPDICTMIRLKQNLYPVMFLTQGMSEKYPPYHDVRCINIEMAVQHAVCQDILGIVVNTEDLLRDSSQISLATDAGLVIFCWGEENNNKETIQYLKKLGLHAVIYDMLDLNINKTVKESVFLLETKESKTSDELLTISMEQNDSIIQREAEPIPKMLDLTEARTLLDNVSTATSLVSISSINQQ
ncbi:glycerophosphocholine phosphodiesterase GPCPD1-like isoform X1 [Ctenocephalides felis]|uniref:glycerophosphocholine phosphodiesterase GPCPD1-like isoform X1 n=2 Tax=Ctenocephalides felis TaxID=7515 RepID=UPI000E6E1B52|nr:glycerophosphocholine phosphodiesterase GPCPD1-like isoform X1 [Ctenocephalides felis]